MAGKKYKPTYVEAGVQTYIEVSSIGKWKKYYIYRLAQQYSTYLFFFLIGIQVDVMELRKLFGVQTQSKVPFNYEDMSDFSDADISTGLFTISAVCLHILHIYLHKFKYFFVLYFYNSAC